MNTVSGCCLKPVVVDRKRHYPLGGSTWYETQKVDVCEGCGLEVDEPVLVHDCCGLEFCDCEVAV